MYFHFAILALAAIGNAATPTTSPRTFVDTFEDKPTQTVQAAGPRASPVGIENGLFYNGFVVGSDVDGVGSGIIAKSQKNVAAGGFINGLNGTTTITVNYPGSKVSSLDLIETYYGCSVTDATNAGAAQGCVLVAYGFYSNGQRTSSQAIPFGFPFDASTATGVTAQPMQRYIFPAYKGLVNVTFAFASSTSAVASSFFQLDNVKHVNYYR